MQCPLCSSSATTVMPVAGQTRRYLACAACRLIFVDPHDHLTPEQERVRYQLHRNSPDDAGYITFLRQVIAPALPLVPRGAAVLDYGCGPVPVLAQLLAAAGCDADSYDPLFKPAPPRAHYEAVFASEVVEHFRAPGEDFAQMLAFVAPGGLLALMTELFCDDTDFARWPYTSDPTHIAFYHAATCAWLANRHGLARVPAGNERVILLRRPA